jgi:hypothetical protein
MQHCDSWLHSAGAGAKKFLESQRLLTVPPLSCTIWPYTNVLILHDTGANIKHSNCGNLLYSMSRSLRVEAKLQSSFSFENR